MLRRLSGGLNRLVKKEQKKHRRARPVPADASRPCSQCAGTQEEKRWLAELHAQRAERIARRKQEKLERKARGARLGSGSSCGTSSTGSTSACDSVEDSGECSTDEPDSEPATLPKECGPSFAFPRNSRSCSRGAVAHESRVRGADIYVVRLMQDTESKAKARDQKRRWSSKPCGDTGATESEPLRYADSRPCWRCLEWMRWAGIKRVSWTNDKGEWMSGKVMDLLYGSSGDQVSLHLTQYERAAMLMRARRGNSL